METKLNGDLIMKKKNLSINLKNKVILLSAFFRPSKFCEQLKRIYKQ